MVQMLEKSYSSVIECERPDVDETLRVMIVDTHTLMREALHRVIVTFPHVQICASLSVLCDVPAMAQKMRAQVIILSSSIPVSDCLNLVALLHENPVLAGIVIIQRCLSPETTMTLIKQGVHGLLGEDGSEEDLQRAIAAAAAGSTFMDRRVREILNSSVSRAPLHLTGREVEVLSLLKRGESNFGIARGLGLKEKTVEKHLSHIYEKLNITSRVEAILEAQRLYI